MQGYLAIPFSWRRRGWQIEEQAWRHPGRESSSLIRVKGLLTGDELHTVSFSSVLCPGNQEWEELRGWKKGGEMKKCERMMKGKDGVMDSAASRSPYVCVRACVRAWACAHDSLLLARVCVVERDALMNEEHPLPFQQWKSLKHPGPQGWAMSQSSILVTYGPATTNT